MELCFCPLHSGSSGNTLYCGSGNTHLLIDAGLPGKTVLAALATSGIKPSELSGILVTHEHTDHVAGVGVLARKLGIPVYANAGTWAAMESKVGKIPPGQIRIFDTDEDFYIGDMCILPFATPHDAAESVGFLLESHGRTVAVATDIGHMTKRVYEHLRQADIVMLESNHDLDMLRTCAYPQILKNRIAGKKGHLSNDICAKTIANLMENGLRTAILGHLSAEANTEALALKTARGALEDAGIPAEDIQLHLARRHVCGRLCRVL